jgi:isopenicillin-N N-acyltransferase-like protein
MTQRMFFSLALVSSLVISTSARSQEKSQQIASGLSAVSQVQLFARPKVDSQAQVTSLSNGEDQVPLVVVQGTPYEMGYQLGQATKEAIHTWVPAALAGVATQLGVAEQQMQEVWSRSASYADDRVEQEMAGMADGAGIELAKLQSLHAASILMPYSCSSIAAWGNATEDGHLYQTRNLDWVMEIGAHNFAVIVVYQPDQGVPHVIPNFAGIVGAHSGMSAKGIVLSEMGDAGDKMAPYQVHAPHFSIYFRTMLYDADSLSTALKIFQDQPPIKAYHFVFGDGLNEKRAVKIRTQADDIAIWNDNDPHDEFFPNVMACTVYNDEGRGAFPTIKRDFGKLSGPKLVDLANQIPIKGGNVVNVVYDATGMKMWVTYAKGETEAYLRKPVFVDLKQYGF